MAFRDAVQGHFLAQLFSALFFVAWLLVTLVMHCYWLYAAVYLMGILAGQPEQSDLEPLRWHRKALSFLTHLISPAGETSTSAEFRNRSGPACAYPKR